MTTETQRPILPTDSRLLDSQFMTKEFMRLICDQHLGGGSTRDVWGSSWLPGVAFKFEPNEGAFANIGEWEFWQETEDQPWQRKWLAPCLAISPCGGVLAMKRCSVIEIDRLPKEVPVWATDTKITNWGMMEDKDGYRAVMLDYHMVISTLTKRTKRPDWWVAG